MTEAEISKTIGANLRLRRQMMGLTCQQLAAQIGISYQQLQKYESGKNRVSAPTLFRLAQILQADFADFFGVESFAGATGTNEILFIAKAYSAIKDDKLRQAVRQLIKAL